MEISPTVRVGEVALELPQATRVFEKLKIDYCCGGDQPLSEACATAGVDVEKVIELIEQSGEIQGKGNGAPDLQRATLTDLIGYILDKHHVYTKDEMSRLEPLTEKVIAAHGTNHSELLAIRDLLRQLFMDLRQHMFKEEQVLFPYILEMERAATFNRSLPSSFFGTVTNPIRMMMMEHDAAGEILREVRRQSANYTVPSDACISYKTLYEALEGFERDLHQHIHLENNLLFPKAIESEAKL